MAFKKKGTIQGDQFKVTGVAITINSQTITVTERNSAGLIVTAYGTAAASTQNSNALYAKDARYFKTDAANGVTGEYRNTGTAAVSAFTLVEGAESTITGIVAGAGLTGDATEGTATLAVGAGSGIVANANDVAVGAGRGISVRAGAVDVGVSIYNNTGGDLTIGTLVNLSGYNSTNGITVTKADADSGIEATHVILDVISNSAAGVAYPVGRATSQNTNGRTIGDLVYVDAATAGGFAFSAPTGADQMVQVVGVVKVVNASTGEIEFFPGHSRITKFSRSQLQDGIITPAKLAQSSSLTATADGTGSGSANVDSDFFEVTSASATNQISLPGISNATKGKTVSFYVGANGFELITPAASNATINGTDADGTNQADIPADSYVRCTCVSNTAWLMEIIGSTGTVAAPVIPDND